MLLKGCKAGGQGELRVPCPSVVVSAAEEQQRLPVVPGRVFLSRQHSSTVSHQGSCQGGPQPVTHSSHPQEIHMDDSLLRNDARKFSASYMRAAFTQTGCQRQKVSESFTRKQSCLLQIWSICLQGKVQRRSPKQHQKWHMGKVHLPLPRKAPALLPVINGKLWYEICMGLAGSAKETPPRLVKGV